jgi:hypothetical protein
MIPDYRNPYRGFDIAITEPRGKGVIVAVLSEEPLKNLEVPAVPKTYAPKTARAVLGKLRTQLRSLRGLAPAPEDVPVIDEPPPVKPDPNAGGKPPVVTIDKPHNDGDKPPVVTVDKPHNDGDKPPVVTVDDRPKWSVAVREYWIK